MRSFLPLVALTTWAPAEIWPEYTRTYVSLPKNGCVAILNASAAKGAFTSGSRTTG